MLNGGVGGVRLMHGPVVASYEHESRFKRIAHGVKIGLSEKAKGSAAHGVKIGLSEKALRVRRHCIHILNRERRRADGT